MEELRWVLLALGVLLVAGVYLWGRGAFKRSELARIRRRRRAEPHIRTEIDPSTDDVLFRRPGELSDDDDASASIRESSLRRRHDDSDDEPDVAAAPRAGFGSADGGIERPASAFEPRASDEPPASEFEPRASKYDPRAPEFDPRASEFDPSVAAELPRGDYESSRDVPNAPSAASEPSGDTAAAPRADAGSGTRGPRFVRAPEKIVAIRFIPKALELDGLEAVDALREAGLEHGRYGIFHAHDESHEALFSVASLTEPGTFDLERLADKPIAGMSFFMVLPGTGDPVERFDAMVQTARSLMHRFDAELFDDAGSSWSIQRERYVREELIQYRHQSAQY